MKRSFLMAMGCLFFFMVIPSMAIAQDDEEESILTPPDPEIEIIILDDGTEEEQVVLSDDAYAPVMIDERYLAIRVNANAQIEAILEQIRQLSDPNDEGDLQRQIEWVKHEADIERLMLMKEDAEDRGDTAVADELAAEIAHRESIRLPDFGRVAPGVSEQEHIEQKGGGHE